MVHIVRLIVRPKSNGAAGAEMKSRNVVFRPHRNGQLSCGLPTNKYTTPTSHSMDFLTGRVREMGGLWGALRGRIVWGAVTSLLFLVFQMPSICPDVGFRYRR